MYEYKVIKSLVDDAEQTFNLYAKKGWRVVTVSPNVWKGFGIAATLEREVKESKDKKE